MKSLFLGLLLLSSQLYASEALTTGSMDDALAKVEEKAAQYGRSNVLLVFDIDNTLLTSTTDFGSDQWYSWQESLIKDPNCRPTCISTNIDELITAQGIIFTLGKMKATEETLAANIQKLQEPGQKIILLTSRGPDFRNLTETALAKNGMKFAVSTLNQASDVTGTYLPYNIKDLPGSGLTQADVDTAGLKESRPVSFQNGVYMTAGQNKGVMLKVLLNKYGQNYKAIIFADDHQRHVDRMQAIMGNISDVTTFRYSKIDSDVQRFNAMDKSEMVDKRTKLKTTITEIGF